MSRSIPFPKALLVGGAVAIAGVAYAIGSQSGDGNAGAATKATASVASGTTAPTRATGPWSRFGGHGPGGGHRPGRGGHGPFAGGPAFGQLLTNAAKDLGVSEEQLKSTLASLRGSFGDERKQAQADLVASLAKSLNLDASKVQAAFDGQGGGSGGPGFGPFGHHADPAALATALGVSQDELRQAFTDFATQEAKSVRAELVKQVAAKLGVSEDKVSAVADKYLPKDMGGGFFGRGMRP